MIRRGEIYWFTPARPVGREHGGRRPAVVIQNDVNNEYSQTTILAMMTSRRFSRIYPTHVDVSAEESGLPDASTVLLEQLQTVSMERLGQPVGHLPPHVMEELDAALHDSLGILFCARR